MNSGQKFLSISDTTVQIKRQTLVDDASLHRAVPSLTDGAVHLHFKLTSSIWTMEVSNVTANRILKSFSFCEARDQNFEENEDSV